MIQMLCDGLEKALSILLTAQNKTGSKVESQAEQKLNRLTIELAQTQ